MDTIKILLAAIEGMKKKIIRLKYDDFIPNQVKEDKLIQMRKWLIETQAVTVNLMQQQLNTIKKAS